MKIVINRCFGGFSLSAHAIARIAELRGHPCFFFVQDLTHGLDAPYVPTSIDDCGEHLFFSAFKVPNPAEVLKRRVPRDEEETKAFNNVYNEIAISTSDYLRHDPTLVAVVEELGAGANGSCAELAVVEIPDGVDYEIADYDGNEHIAEKHRTWG